MFKSLALLALLPATLGFVIGHPKEFVAPRQTKELVVSGGNYTITNAKAGTVVDLSAYDGSSIIGYPFHNGTNQQWTVEWAGTGWTFKSISNGYYIGANATAAANGVNITAVATASSEPSLWHIWHDEDNEEAYRIFVPNTTQVLDLYARGDPFPGEPITLWDSWKAPHQTWIFAKVSV